jgi:hypothetical protein
MKIAILSPSDVASWYAATLMERGHQITIGPFGHVPTAVSRMLKDGIDGVLILTDDDDNLQEIAARRLATASEPVHPARPHHVVHVDLRQRRAKSEGRLGNSYHPRRRRVS